MEKRYEIVSENIANIVKQATYDIMMVLLADKETGGVELLNRMSFESVEAYRAAFLSQNKVEPVEVPEVETPKKSTKKAAPKIDIDTLRKRLSELMKAGKKAEVKELLTEFAGEGGKLSDVPEDKYEALYEKAGALDA